MRFTGRDFEASRRIDADPNLYTKYVYTRCVNKIRQSRFLNCWLLVRDTEATVVRVESGRRLTLRIFRRLPMVSASESWLTELCAGCAGHSNTLGDIGRTTRAVVLRDGESNRLVVLTLACAPPPLLLSGTGEDGSCRHLGTPRGSLAFLARCAVTTRRRRSHRQVSNGDTRCRLRPLLMCDSKHEYRSGMLN